MALLQILVPSSSGLGHCPLKAETAVRLRPGLLKNLQIFSKNLRKKQKIYIFNVYK